MYNEDERQYLQMMQDNITRMATNSANAKTWLVTIVAAFLAIGCNIKDFDYWLLLALVPTAVFWYLDALYLKLERELRNREQRYINIRRGAETCNEDNLDEKDPLFDFRPLSKDKDDKTLRYVETGCQIFNTSVFPLYLVMALVVLIITGVVNGWFSCPCC